MTRSPRTSPSRHCTRHYAWCSQTPSICFSARCCVDRGRNALRPVPSRGAAIRPLPHRRRCSEPVRARHLLSGDAGDRGGAEASPDACERDRLRPGLCGEPRLDVPVERRGGAVASALRGRLRGELRAAGLDPTCRRRPSPTAPRVGGALRGRQDGLLLPASAALGVSRGAGRAGVTSRRGSPYKLPRPWRSAGVPIPFNRPTLAGMELDYIRDAIARGQLAGDGAYTERCQAWLREQISAGAVLLTHSCTAALEMAALLLDIGPGDEVVMPSFTFVSTANAVVLRGGVPVFVDIRPDTLNIDEALVEAAVTPRTRAIMPVHYAGVPAEMDALDPVARRHGLSVIEDAAQALGSTYRGRNAGTLGSLAAFSFHETKNIISGEGGCLAINDPALIERAEIIREKGTNRKRFFRGEVDKYTWVDIGSSFLPGELIAFLYGQLEAADAIRADRRRSWDAYDLAFRSWHNRGVRTPSVPAHCEDNAHLYYLILPSAEQRAALIAACKADGIMTPFHYVPLHDSPAGRRLGRACGELAVTEDLAARLVRLPLFPCMGDALSRVIERVQTHLDRLL